MESIAGKATKQPPAPYTKIKQPVEKELILPAKNYSNGWAIAYLERRGIDIDIIRFCIENSLLYEGLPYHNVIFIGKDNNGVPRYASFRSTRGSKYIGEVSGCDKRYSFRLLSSVPEKLKPPSIFLKALLICFHTLR